MSNLPKTLAELKQLSQKELTELWKKYFFNEHYSEKPIIKALWYRIQCVLNNSYVEDRHQTKLNRYAKSPDEHIKKSIKYKINLKAGTEIIRNYKGRRHIVMVKDKDCFLYNDKEFNTLSAVAIEICGKKVSGNHFFGLHNKSTGETVNGES